MVTLKALKNKSISSTTNDCRQFSNGAMDTTEKVSHYENDCNRIQEKAKLYSHTSPPKPTLTLSMGNVHFVLVPDNSPCLIGRSNGLVSFQQDPSGAIILNLQSFSGSLRVLQSLEESTTVPVTNVVPKTPAENGSKSLNRVRSNNTKKCAKPNDVKSAAKKPINTKTNVSMNGDVETFSKDENVRPTDELIRPAKRSRGDELSIANVIDDPPSCEKKADSVARDDETLLATSNNRTQSISPNNLNHRMSHTGDESSLSQCLLLNDDELDGQSWHDVQMQPNLGQTEFSPQSQTQSGDTANTISRDDECNDSTKANNVSGSNKINNKSRVRQIMEDGDTVHSSCNDNDGDIEMKLSDSGNTSSSMVSHNPNFIMEDSPEVCREPNSSSCDADKKIVNHAMQKSNAIVAQDTIPANDYDFDVAESSPVTTIPSNGRHIPPCSRWGHTMNAVGNNRIILYGGQTVDDVTRRPQTLGDVYIYDLVKHVWFQPFNCDGIVRQWHTSTFLKDRNLIICFGGETINPKNGKKKTTDQVMILDTEIMLWYPPTITGVAPGGRSGHTATFLSKTNEIIVFGGVAQGNRWINTISILDTQRWIWTTPKKVHGLAPKPRSYHSAVAVGDTRIVFFGGNDARQSFNTVHVLEVLATAEPNDGNGNIVLDNTTDDDSDGGKTKKNRRKKSGKDDCSGSNTCFVWKHPTTSGDVPTPRTGQTATLLPDKKTILVYGGWDPSMEEDDTETQNTIRTNDEEIIFGTTHLLNTETWVWSKGPDVYYAVFPQNQSFYKDGGPKRVGHAAVLTTLPEKSTGSHKRSTSTEYCNAVDSEVLVFGGRVPGDRFTGDFQVLQAPRLQH